MIVRDLGSGPMDNININRISTDDIRNHEVGDGSDAQPRQQSMKGQ
jgi:hypothetical protein